MYRVIATIKHSDGDIEPRRVYLEHLSREDAERHAELAVKLNDCVTDAWIEEEADKFTERENATFGKRTPKGKREGCFDI